ncbi:response regulator transcription factor [soil metagenome]
MIVLPVDFISVLSYGDVVSRILVVEDNEELADNVGTWLQNEQHKVDTVADGVEALRYLRTYEYDVIILDWTLPKMSGIEVLKQYRANRGATPVLMLTGRRDLDDKEFGLDAGADDYLTKPFELRELSARLRALLRRAPMPPSEQLTFGDLVLDKQSKRITKAGNDVKLMPKDFAVLELLMTYPDKVFSAESLIERVWSEGEASAEVVRKHINKIRTQIDSPEKQSFIRTVHGIGYSFNNKTE